MKLIIALPLSFCFLFPIRTLATSTYKTNSVCKSFADGKLDALKTLKALKLDVQDYSIGVNNTAKIFCS